VRTSLLQGHFFIAEQVVNLAKFYQVGQVVGKQKTLTPSSDNGQI